MLKFLTGAAALALAASAVSADPGGGKGGDKGNGGGGNPQAMQGGGKSGEKHAKDDRGQAEQSASDKRKDGRGNGKAAVADNRGRDDRGKGFESHNKGKSAAYDDDRRAPTAKYGRESGARHDGAGWRWADAVPQRRHGLFDGCPPGLAKKHNGCMPPGLARKSGAGAAFFDRPDWWGLNDRWHDNVNWNDGRYGYYDGYMVRYGDNGIQSWLPLLGGALSPGNIWPSQYQSVGLPPYYQDYYGLGASDGYRYYDDTLYRVDPQSNAITAIAALLTGNSIDVGQRMPQGYDVYNVPYSYRDQYVDGPDADYRYSDGYVYEVDPTTQLVQAAIQLLT